MEDHAKAVGLDASSITFDDADSDASKLLKALAVLFAFSGLSQSQHLRSQARYLTVHLQIHLPVQVSAFR